MPPIYTDEGLRAAREIGRAPAGEWHPRALTTRRRALPARAAFRRDGRVGYLFKKRVSDLDELFFSIQRIGQEDPCSTRLLAGLAPA
jgi:hypothetical protein